MDFTLSDRTMRVLLAVAVSVTLIAGGVWAVSAVYFGYEVDYNDACRSDGHDGAIYSDPTNAFSWFCYDASNTSPRVMEAGDLDTNRWCIENYPGSHVELRWNSVSGWRCVYY